MPRGRRAQIAGRIAHGSPGPTPIQSRFSPEARRDRRQSRLHLGIERKGGLSTSSPARPSLPSGASTAISILSALAAPAASTSPTKALPAASDLIGIPDQIDAGGEFAEGFAHRRRRGFEFVRRLEGRIDQHQPAPFRRRQQRQQPRIAVGLLHPRLAPGRQHLFQRAPLLPDASRWPPDGLAAAACRAAIRGEPG